ncbi:MAG TPA: J domain-containing protein [Kofleriaceae bacterium]|nr:J domain-containing protein [Kofleriaceae bacterium]
MAARTLHVRCATWDQVETFTKRKLRKGRLLSMKVPFQAKIGSPVTLGLELPNEMVMAIDGVIQRASPVEGDPQRMWIEVDLTGLTEETLTRIKNLAARGNDDVETDPQIPVPAAPTRKSSMMGAVGEELPADERALFQQLSSELRRMRTAAVHEVLGVPKDPTPEQLRDGWKAHIRRHHPDLVARRGAPAITHLAEELTILGNRAYDRLRIALMSKGEGIKAGSLIATPPGWLVGFEDIQSGDATPVPKTSPRRFERPPTPQPVAPQPPPAAPPQGAEAFEHRARAQLRTGDANAAREVLAAALVVYPRSKPLRSLYYVATALAALQEGELVLATTQLETALAHHEQCIEASRLLEHVRRHGAGSPERLKRVFE